MSVNAVATRVKQHRDFRSRIEKIHLTTRVAAQISSESPPDEFSTADHRFDSGASSAVLESKYLKSLPLLATNTRIATNENIVIMPITLTSKGVCRELYTLYKDHLEFSTPSGGICSFFESKIDASRYRIGSYDTWRRSSVRQTTLLNRGSHYHTIRGSRTMARRKEVVPSYLLHKPTGQARVRINGRDIYLGEYGSEESRIRYGELIARHASGLPIIDPVSRSRAERNAQEPPAGPSVGELLLGYPTGGY